ncbi:putative uncharacterized protein DDB_G0287975 isoform X1 [Solanum pennellii]|uniref:Uncharacterized protein n=1 Tax=Solanum pennellii TaxID=28526 RepID=A0ABM1GYE0_SOLPN|nr:putative uncharacterized protein DDB_G0287975 isoform X1 [Solanum pennellii]
MQIQVKCSCGEEKCPEWAILELQGVVEVQPSFKDRLQNLQIGTLCRPTSQENYTFTVGYHELTGTKMPLKKPMLVLKKIKLSTEEEKGDINSTKVELDVIGVIRQRILFKTRPKALISKKFMWLLGVARNLFLDGVMVLTNSIKTQLNAATIKVDTLNTTLDTIKIERDNLKEKMDAMKASTNFEVNKSMLLEDNVKKMKTLIMILRALVTGIVAL